MPQSLTTNQAAHGSGTKTYHGQHMQHDISASAPSSLTLSCSMSSPMPCFGNQDTHTGMLHSLSFSSVNFTALSFTQQKTALRNTCFQPSLPLQSKLGSGSSDSNIQNSPQPSPHISNINLGTLSKILKPGVSAEQQVSNITGMMNSRSPPGESQHAGDHRGSQEKTGTFIEQFTKVRLDAGRELQGQDDMRLAAMLMSPTHHPSTPPKNADMHSSESPFTMPSSGGGQLIRVLSSPSLQMVSEVTFESDSDLWELQTFNLKDLPACIGTRPRSVS